MQSKCFIIKEQGMKFNFFINEIMTKKSGILTAVAVATAISTTPASAETNNQVAKQKIEQITCSTRLACEKLSLSIQAQINELEAKGLENLTEKEFNKYDKLSDKLIALEKQETQAEKAETQKAYSEVSDKLASIEGSLL